MDTLERIRDELVRLSRELGREERQLAILGEGNTSAGCGDGSFWVKASGSSLATMEAADLTRVDGEAVMELLEREAMEEQEVEEALLAARCDPAHKKPSVETFLHALCLREEGTLWAGHTHAVAVNRILCSRLGAEPFRRHLFPDAIVVCGRLPAVIPYVDPGFALAKAVQQELRRYHAEQGHPPRLLLMENHGLVALGRSSREVLNVMLMADKWARILWGTYALEGPRFLSEEDADRIDRRLDEAYRRRRLAGS